MQVAALLPYDTLVIPSLITGASAFVLVLQWIFAAWTRKSQPSSITIEEPENEPTPRATLSTCLRMLIDRSKGSALVVYQLTRVLGCLVLFGLSLYLLNVPGNDNVQRWSRIDQELIEKSPSILADPLQLGMCITFAYASFLAFLAFASQLWLRKLVSKHLNLVLVSTLAVYFHRDVFPLATYTDAPLDLAEGQILWVKIITLTVTGAVAPLLVPRQYIPVDAKNPSATPNPEQIASILSLMIYSFLDPIIFLAYRIPHLSHDQLPPLADYDHAHQLKAKSFPYLDPFRVGRKRHIFFGLMRVFHREYTILAGMIIIQVFASFASPLGIKQLLQYLESGGTGAIIRPWFWILWLFVGPFVVSLAWQWYIYIATRTLVRAEGIITQLIFEHSLRIRMKAEADSGSPGASRQDSTPLTPDIIAVDSPHQDDETSSYSHGPTASSESTAVDSLHMGENASETSSSSMQSGSSVKGKSKPSEISEASKQPGSSGSSNLIGKINNLVTTDLENIVDSRDFLLVLLDIPLKITLSIFFLYEVLGWSSFVGLATILLLFPLPGYVAKRIQVVQEFRLKATDARVQTVTEIMNVLRMVKLFGWEKKMDKNIAEKRDTELGWVWKRQVLDLINGNLNFLIPVMTMITTYTTYASKVFSSMTVFDMLRDQLHMVFFAIPQFVTGRVSLDRVNDFLTNTELLDDFTGKEPIGLFRGVDGSTDERIGFRDATFAWSCDTDGSLTPSKRGFSLHIEGELFFTRGHINVITGPTGSGKTSLLMALLGEMHFLPSGPESWYNLPRSSGVAYAAQESWVLNDTIKNNILFGSPLDEVRYRKVLHQCSLEHDLTLFEASDETEVGEKGLTLSGGQKARITLARAIYSSAEIILLDDVLAALDVHTARWIVEKCLNGDLIQGRTVLLVTHNIAMARPIAKFVVSMGLDGSITSQEYLDVPVEDKFLPTKVRGQLGVIGQDEVIADVDNKLHSSSSVDTGAKSDGKLIAAEEIEMGHVSWAALRLYLRGLGGSHPTLFFATFVGGLFVTELSNAAQTWYLGYWASQYNDKDPAEIPVFNYLGIYGALLLFAVLVYCTSYLIYIFGALRAARSIHDLLVKSILGTTLRWLDITPVSRVITRCTRDIRAVDGPIATGLMWLSELTMAMLVKFGAVVLLTPAFLLPGITVASLGGCCGQIYIAAQLSVKREMSNAKSPVLGHFGAAIAGLTSIRAYGAQKAFEAESLVRIDRYTRAARTYYNLNRWIAIRIDALGGLFAAALASYLVYFQGHSAANTGFSLNMAVGFSGMILWWVRVLNDFEVQGNSLERIQGYLQIEQEPKATQSGLPPAYWPASGEIRVENLSAKYSQDGPEVLHDISFHVKAGSRIGVVGRTGSGKSSLTLALLRCIFTEGNVYFDGLNTNNINLDALRSNITIIPQTPELISGTLRQNLDPFDQYDDAALNAALRAAGLFSLQGERYEDRITLDSPIASGGGNLSVGQRQILALARAMARGSKLLILDEATSAIDYKTDSVIQSSLRHELPADVTVITVAHRLQTIMDADKIMVLDAGSIVEFDSPQELLELPNGKLRSLVDESGDKDFLYAMAKGETRQEKDE